MRIFVLALIASALGAQDVKLWPNGSAEPEASLPSDDPRYPKKFTVVHQPSIYPFLPPKGTATGVALIIAPGGGHSQLVIDKEGWDVAKWANAHGMAAFVLKYRLARAPGSKYTVEHDALADAVKAVAVVRERAAEWGVNPARIGFMGFSAGGAVAALLESRVPTKPTERPDFNIIVYPGWAPNQVPAPPKDAPPAFLVCADNDPSHVVTTVNYYLALQKAGVSTEMHIYSSGAHGFGMKASAMPVATWPQRVLEWMGDRKLDK